MFKNCDWTAFRNSSWTVLSGIFKNTEQLFLNISKRTVQDLFLRSCSFTSVCIQFTVHVIYFSWHTMSYYDQDSCQTHCLRVLCYADPIKTEYWYTLTFTIYPRNCPVQFALMKTFNRFSYCTELRRIFSNCTELRSHVHSRTTFARWSTWKKNRSHFSLSYHVKERWNYRVDRRCHKVNAGWS